MEQTDLKESTMPATAISTDLDDILREVGPDSTATFDNTASNPTEHASSESLYAAADPDLDEEDEDEEDEDEDEDDDDDDEEEEDVDDDEDLDDEDEDEDEEEDA